MKWRKANPRPIFFTLQTFPLGCAENNFLPYFGHFSTNLAKKNCGPQTTIWTLFRPRNQLFTIFWPFFDQFGQKKTEMKIKGPTNDMPSTPKWKYL